MTHTASKTSDVPLAVWPCAQRTCQQQRHGRYLPESSRHPDELLPELARRVIDGYSDPGDLVVDPICGAGTTLVEAVRLDRDAIGVESNARWAELAAANIEKARSDGAPGRARVLSGDGRDLPRLLARKQARTLREPVDARVARLPHASVDLVLTSLPPMRTAMLERYAASAAVVPAGRAALLAARRRPARRDPRRRADPHHDVRPAQPPARQPPHLARGRARLPTSGSWSAAMSGTALSVWPVTQHVAATQRRGRYVSESKAHPGRMLPVLARRAIETYTAPEDLVIDPMCGIGTTLVEAIHLGRRAVGVELEPRWVAVAARNVRHARKHGAEGQALVMRGDARTLGRGLLDQLHGQAALILTSPPYGSSTHGHLRNRATRIEKFDYRYSNSRTNLGELSTLASGTTIAPQLRDALVEILTGSRRLLSPTGRLVMTTRPYRHRGALIDLPGVVVRLAADAGLTLEARHVALLAGLRDSRLVPRHSFFQLNRQRRGTIPRMLLIAHEDVLVFRAR